MCMHQLINDAKTGKVRVASSNMQRYGSDSVGFDED